MKKVHYVLLVIMMLLSSCGKKRFADKILQMQSRPIDMTPCEKAYCYEEGKEVNYNSKDSTYKLVIYIDSLSCSPCFVSHMQDYMETVIDFDSLGITTFLIFEPKQEQKEVLVSSIKQQAHPIRCIIVPNRSFSLANSHLPSSSVFHSFLINEDNNVIIVGNPVKNARIRSLMQNIITNSNKKGGK